MKEEKTILNNSVLLSFFLYLTKWYFTSNCNHVSFFRNLKFIMEIQYLLLFLDEINPNWIKKIQIKKSFFFVTITFPVYFQKKWKKKEKVKRRIKTRNKSMKYRSTITSCTTYFFGSLRDDNGFREYFINRVSRFNSAYFPILKYIKNYKLNLITTDLLKINRGFFS